MRQPIQLIRTTQPLNEIDLSKCYAKQIAYNPETKRCYAYSGDPFKGWIEIHNTTLSKEDKHEDVLECKACGAKLQSMRCEYCGTYSWKAKEFFGQ